MQTAGGQGLYDRGGRRKYLSHAEAARFLQAAEGLPARDAALCRALYWTGCRISEALEVGPDRLDLESARLVLRTLKQHHRGQASEHAPVRYRAVPIPVELVEELVRLPVGADGLYWPWSRQSAWRHIKSTMEVAGISGVPACPKGLRHHFGLMAATADVPPSLIKRWMGHAKLETTMIYLEAMDAEERAFAERMWRR